MVKDVTGCNSLIWRDAAISTEYPYPLLQAEFSEGLRDPLYPKSRSRWSCDPLLNSFRDSTQAFINGVNFLSK